MSPGCYSTVFSIEIAFCLLAGAFAARPGRDDLLSSEQQQHQQQQQKQPEPAESLELCEMIRDTVCQYDASDNTLFFHGFTGACGSVLKPLCERRCECFNSCRKSVFSSGVPLPISVVVVAVVVVVVACCCCCYVLQIAVLCGITLVNSG
ncbi:unnamed protein product [Polarella glacialis]|uniref:Uncharacterized protein n=1 Tax=Polarella glacialis TaxID=89957 RepID=A0A813HWP8_POLGL|nr:unnamed protein product [Polarella glacialis]